MKRLLLQILQYNKNNVLIFCRFLGSDDPNTFFSRAQRSRMVYEILATTPFGKEKKGEVGIERMVEEGAYSAAFPLHDVSLSLLICLNYDHIRQNIQFRMKKGACFSSIWGYFPRLPIYFRIQTGF